MQVSIKWLKDYIDFTETPEQLADKLTMAGIPVENVVDPGEGLEKVVTGRIEKLEPHQNSDHLQICTKRSRRTSCSCSYGRCSFAKWHENLQR